MYFQNHIPSFSKNPNNQNQRSFNYVLLTNAYSSLSNIEDGAFCKISLGLLGANFFETAPS